MGIKRQKYMFNWETNSPSIIKASQSTFKFQTKNLAIVNLYVKFRNTTA